MASKGKVGLGKRVAPAPKAKTSTKTTTKSWKAEHSHLFSKNPKSFSIGGDIPPKKNLSRCVLWPKYIRLQRQRAVLKKRLKVPPAINQFTRAMDKNQASTLFRFLLSYRPETELDKKKRLKQATENEAKTGETKQSAQKPVVLKFGLNHITHLIESKKAKLVVIAHDVDPIELVVFLPALCRKMNIPYCIVKGKARLGHLVHHRTVTAVALTEVKREDQAKLEQLVQSCRLSFNDNVSERRKWGGGVMGIKAVAVQKKREKIRVKELKGKLF